jgi:hypothetical protein
MPIEGPFVTGELSLYRLVPEWEGLERRPTAHAFGHGRYLGTATPPFET